MYIHIRDAIGIRRRERMRALHFTTALTADGWADDVRIEIEGGRVARLEAGADPGGAERHAIGVPGLASLHSHAFQRGMAGLAEYRSTAADTFWSWRETMYRFALTVDPEDVADIARQLYVEMLEAGFTAVGEFHYLHHDRDGRPYADVGELAGRIAGAAADAGIGLTLLPVYYRWATFGRVPGRPEQRRFLSDPDLFARLLEGAERAVAGLDGAGVGVAPHSLRAATIEEVRQVAAMAAGRPIHIHVAEQVKEVEDCLAATGARPVRHLLDGTDAGEGWCLIHATHMTDDETADVARRGAVAGLCPVTEANLGDGVFPTPAFLAAGGAFGVGTDSNVLVDPAAELRQLEYAQRLSTRTRNVIAGPAASTGRTLFDGALAGGAKALGRPAGALAPGAPADIVSLDGDHPSLVARTGDALLDAFVFVAGRSAVDTVWVAGRKVVENGMHHRRAGTAEAYRACLRRLVGRM
jgi:formiminoglutamate deiminase